MFNKFNIDLKEFEQYIPHEMRAKSLDDHGDTLYWITQDDFDKEQLMEFKKALEQWTNYKAALVSSRYHTSWDFNTDFWDETAAWITLNSRNKKDIELEGLNNMTHIEVHFGDSDHSYDTECFDNIEEARAFFREIKDCYPFARIDYDFLEKEALAANDEEVYDYKHDDLNEMLYDRLDLFSTYEEAEDAAIEAGLVDFDIEERDGYFILKYNEKAVLPDDLLDEGKFMNKVKKAADTFDKKVLGTTEEEYIDLSDDEDALLEVANKYTDFSEALDACVEYLFENDELARDLLTRTSGKKEREVSEEDKHLLESLLEEISKIIVKRVDANDRHDFISGIKNELKDLIDNPFEEDESLDEDFYPVHDFLDRLAKEEFDPAYPDDIFDLADLDEIKEFIASGDITEDDLPALQDYFEDRCHDILVRDEEPEDVDFYDDKYDIYKDDRKYRFLDEAKITKDMFVVKPFNYTINFNNEKSNDINSAVIVIPDAIQFEDGSVMDATVFAEDEDGRVLNFATMKDAKDWVSKYGDNARLHVEHGDELHATPQRKSYTEDLGAEKSKIFTLIKEINPNAREDNYLNMSPNQMSKVLDDMRNNKDKYQTLDVDTNEDDLNGISYFTGIAFNPEDGMLHHYENGEEGEVATEEEPDWFNNSEYGESINESVLRENPDIFGIETDAEIDAEANQRKKVAHEKRSHVINADALTLVHNYTMLDKMATGATLAEKKKIIMDYARNELRDARKPGSRNFISRKEFENKPIDEKMLSKLADYILNHYKDQDGVKYQRVNTGDNSYYHKDKNGVNIDKAHWDNLKLLDEIGKQMFPFNTYPQYYSKDGKEIYPQLMSDRDENKLRKAWINDAKYYKPEPLVTIDNSIELESLPKLDEGLVLLLPEEDTYDGENSIILNAANDVMAAYQNANKWLDTTKEEIYTGLGCVFFSSLIHNLAHTMPGRFDKFGDILHTCDIKIPYPATADVPFKVDSIDSAFKMIFTVLDDIKVRLNVFIKSTDEDFHGMSCAAEGLLNDIESEYPMLFRLRQEWEHCAGDMVKFDKYVGQYVNNKDGLLESLNEADKNGNTITVQELKDAICSFLDGCHYVNYDVADGTFLIEFTEDALKMCTDDDVRDMFSDEFDIEIEEDDDGEINVTVNDGAECPIITFNESFADNSDKMKRLFDALDFFSDDVVKYNIEENNKMSDTHDVEHDIELESALVEEPILNPRYDSAKSFYEKARTENENGAIVLYSYDTPVACIFEGKAYMLPDWDYGPTTLRHVREFLKQNNKPVYSKADMLKHYPEISSVDELSASDIELD